MYEKHIKLFSLSLIRIQNMKIIDGKPEYRGAVVRFIYRSYSNGFYGYFLFCGAHITTYVIFGVLMIRVFVFSVLKLFVFSLKWFISLLKKKRLFYKH